MRLTAFISGLLFSLGLSIAGMTRPEKVLAFLDVGGAWDPSLAFVMAGAVAVTAIAFRLASRRASPILGDRFDLPRARQSVGPRLVVGAVLFGVGWGLGGLCPGPAVVSLAGGQSGPWVFVWGMVGGMLFVRAVAPRRSDLVSRGVYLSRSP